MKLLYCHVTGGVHNFNFHAHLSASDIEDLRSQGCKVKIIWWEFAL